MTALVLVVFAAGMGIGAITASALLADKETINNHHDR